MRPQSIVMFERLFLGSLALSAVNVLVSYRDATAVLANDPNAQQLGLGGGFLIGAMVASFAIYLLLWYLIARKASTVAKWILVVFVALGALSAMPALTGPWTSTLVLSLVVYTLEILAVAYLFRADATAWLGGKEPADSSTVD